MTANEAKRVAKMYNDAWDTGNKAYGCKAKARIGNVDSAVDIYYYSATQKRHIVITDYADRYAYLDKDGFVL